MTSLGLFVNIEHSVQFCHRPINFYKVVWGYSRTSKFSSYLLLVGIVKSIFSIKYMTMADYCQQRHLTAWMALSEYLYMTHGLFQTIIIRILT